MFLPDADNDGNRTVWHRPQSVGSRAPSPRAIWRRMTDPHSLAGRTLGLYVDERSGIGVHGSGTAASRLPDRHPMAYRPMITGSDRQPDVVESRRRSLREPSPGTSKRCRPSPLGPAAGTTVTVSHNDIIFNNV